ncbi:MAG TPA: hypothetical protein VGO43_14805 [Pyrinomonadaceae bacterium]|nr:hypothetical protein [Pyrinomonadaceae bacterium]
MSFRNKFKIPAEVLTAIRERDRACAYCGKAMVFPYERARCSDSATIEHLNRDGPFDWPECQAEDLVICCSACNSSRGQKLLTDWFASRYCLDRKITAETVSDAVREYLRRTVG